MISSHSTVAVPKLGLTILFWGVAALAVFTMLPFVAQSGFGLPTLGDLQMYVLVQDKGVSETVGWYYQHSTSRYVIILFHALTAKLIQFVGGNPWYWTMFAGPAYLVFAAASFTIFFRTLIARLRWPLAIAMGALSFTALMLIGNTAQSIWPFFSVFYTTTLALFTLFISCWIKLIENQNSNGKLIPFLTLVSFSLLVGSHEFTIIPMGIFLFLVFVLSLKFGGAGQPLSVMRPLSAIKIGVTFRPAFDNRTSLAMFVILGVLLCIAAWVHLDSPSVTARAGGWPPAAVLWAAALAPLPKILNLIATSLDPAKPYFLLTFLLLIFLTKALSARNLLGNYYRYFLFVPPIVFLAVAGVAAITVAAVMGGNAVVPRIQYMLTGMSFVALSSLAVFAGVLLPSRFMPRRFASGINVGILLLLFSLAVKDVNFRKGVEVAFDSGFKFASLNFERSELLSKGSNRVVRVAELERPPFWVEGLHHGPNAEAGFQKMMARAYGQKKIIFMPCGVSIDPLWCHYRFNPLDGMIPDIMPPGSYHGAGMKIQEERLKKQRKR